MRSPDLPNYIKKIDSRHRLATSICLATFVLVILPHSLHLPTRILAAWNCGIYCLLTLSLVMMFKATPQTMRRNAKLEYQGRVAIFILIVAAACASVLAIGFLLTDKGISPMLLTLHVLLAVTTIIGSWLLVHTVFAQQYARNYYQDHESSNEQIAGGLDFPSDVSRQAPLGLRQPDFWDFLYFSFVIGMTSQVSDVQTTSRDMRRLALLHGILSFFFNTTILAMSINIIASLINK
ncbi:DUF1345 domain-containing protein [Scytonema hofmannii FACHB-248]|uniref:DUF1345 domain-containing protein n=1 Tax=Scytonema hofmannii FACHB-248 TaxID=1842502 RepID=A0ABR8GY30_9CYAN|nr:MULTISPECIES: DUF1345 domain-containing protein [Nostocales]MBD2608034.1 DUF1345 domain-containing protein [Scytonema hofmannii FACHB-248]